MGKAARLGALCDLRRLYLQQVLRPLARLVGEDAGVVYEMDPVAVRFHVCARRLVA